MILEFRVTKTANSPPHLRPKFAVSQQQASRFRALPEPESCMSLLAAGVIFGLTFLIGRIMLRKRSSSCQNVDIHDPDATDPPLLQKHSTIKSFSTPKFKYDGIRVFFRPHEQIDRLPKDPDPLPLLVFIHGLGGSVAQFHPLLITLIHVASCLAMDLPGCGRSKHVTNNWDVYKPENLLELLGEVIEQHRDVETGQKVVLIGHSMGTALAARLANKNIEPPHLRYRTSRDVVGLIAISPPAGPPTGKREAQLRSAIRLPEFAFDLWRAWDRRGGTESHSVRRFVGSNADLESKRLQDRFNNQSRTPVWRRMVSGLLDSLPGKESWRGLDIPVFLVGGQNDDQTPAADIEKLEDWIQQATIIRPQTLGDPASGQPNLVEPRRDSAMDENAPSSSSDNDDNDDENDVPPKPAARKLFVAKKVLEGTHALMYMQPTARVLAGLISDFLSHQVSGRFDQAWQLRYLSKEGKWDVKNLEKWRRVAPVSDPIGGVFHAMKTLRQKDEEHTPEVFVKTYGHVIRDVVDISHQTPVYNPGGLEAGGIRYHKFPTVSKIPPPEEEVDMFIQLVDKLRGVQAERAKREGWAPGWAIGVHCHYGFNRTGYFIVCYLVERCEYSVGDAIVHFAEARPNGIKHQHFLDKLYLRYAGR